MNEQPDLLLVYEERIPEETFVPLIEEVKRTGASFRSEKIPSPEPYAGMEWYVPTAAVLFIASSYFGGFFQEMGKEHYHSLKNGIKSLKNKFFGPNPEHNYYSVGTNGKVAKKQIFSSGFSIYAKTKSGQTIKFLFFDKAADSLLEKTLNCYVEALAEYYGPGEEDYLSVQINKLKKVPPVLVVYYNPKDSRPEIIDHNSIINTEE